MTAKVWLIASPANTIIATALLWASVGMGVFYLSLMYYRVWSAMQRERTVLKQEIPMIVGGNEEIGKDTVFRATVYVNQIVPDEDQQQITKMEKEEPTLLGDPMDVVRAATAGQSKVVRRGNLSKGLSTHRTGSKTQKSAYLV